MGVPDSYAAETDFFFSRRVPVEEVSEALRPRTGSDLRSTRDLEGRSSSMERAHLRHRPQYARRSPGRREPYHQSQAAPAAALPLSKRSSSYIRNRSSLEPLRVLQRHRPLPARRPPPSNSEAPREVKSGHGKAPPWAWMFHGKCLITVPASGSSRRSIIGPWPPGTKTASY